jgi:hypothetical protein
MEYQMNASIRIAMSVLLVGTLATTLRGQIAYPSGGETINVYDDVVVRWDSTFFDEAVSIEVWNVYSGQTTVLVSSIAGSTGFTNVNCTLLPCGQKHVMKIRGLVTNKVALTNGYVDFASTVPFEKKMRNHGSKDRFEVVVYPNPFNPRTTIRVQSASPNERYKLVVCDFAGQVVAMYDICTDNNGELRISLDLSNLPTGIYAYVLTGKSAVKTGKLILAK